MSNTRFFNPRRNGAWSGIGIDRAAARSNAMHSGRPALVYHQPEVTTANHDATTAAGATVG
jgi:hypothetical protein